MKEWIKHGKYKNWREREKLWALKQNRNIRMPLKWDSEQKHRLYANVETMGQFGMYCLKYNSLLQWASPVCECYNISMRLQFIDEAMPFHWHWLRSRNFMKNVIWQRKICISSSISISFDFHSIELSFAESSGVLHVSSQYKVHLHICSAVLVYLQD